MAATALLDLGADLLRRVLALQHPADSVVSAFFRDHRSLGQRERHALAETVYAVLRRRLLFQHLAQSGPGPMERRLAILGWPGNDGSLRAALSEPERAWLDQTATVDRAVLPDALRHNLPGWLAEALERRLGDEFWRFVDSLWQPAPLDLRVNLLKSRRDAVRAALAATGIETVPTTYSPIGLRVSGKPALTRLDPYTHGDVEVQDEGSQLIALLVEARRAETVVDFCAGAGGKTLALGAAMRNTGRLYAFDASGHRLAAFKPRLARSGLANVHLVQIAHERDDRVQRLTGKVDRVLVDAPCSGLGTLRRHPDLKWRQSAQGVDELAARQRAILASAAALVKPGGRLVYATCSVLDAENEAVAAAFEADARGAFVPLAAADVLARAGVADTGRLVEGSRLRLWPHRHQTDGFFAAVWQRR